MWMLPSNFVKESHFFVFPSCHLFTDLEAEIGRSAFIHCSFEWFYNYFSDAFVWVETVKHCRSWVLPWDVKRLISHHRCHIDGELQIIIFYSLLTCDNHRAEQVQAEPLWRRSIVVLHQCSSISHIIISTPPLKISQWSKVPVNAITPKDLKWTHVNGWIHMSSNSWYEAISFSLPVYSMVRNGNIAMPLTTWHFILLAFQPCWLS